MTAEHAHMTPEERLEMQERTITKNTKVNLGLLIAMGVGMFTMFTWWLSWTSNLDGKLDIMTTSNAATREQVSVLGANVANLIVRVDGMQSAQQQSHRLEAIIVRLEAHIEMMGKRLDKLEQK